MVEEGTYLLKLEHERVPPNNLKCGEIRLPELKKQQSLEYLWYDIGITVFVKKKKLK
jgi:hypothetical protein